MRANDAGVRIVVESRRSRGSVAAGDFNDKTAEPWGDVLCEAYTTAHGSDGLLVGVRQDVCVQVFPVYPFLQRSILQCRPVRDVQGCPTFVLWLPRDLNAHLFWKRRDLLAPYFWNDDGSPGALARPLHARGPLVAPPASGAPRVSKAPHLPC